MNFITKTPDTGERFLLCHIPYDYALKRTSPGRKSATKMKIQQVSLDI